MTEISSLCGVTGWEVGAWPSRVLCSQRVFVSDREGSEEPSGDRFLFFPGWTCHSGVVRWPPSSLGVPDPGTLP